jgi:type II secretory ATPase GspE/PulE/Tfp pilus assembly ATPase PilB-like protein
MGCINVDGTLTRSGKLILSALHTPMTPEEAARETGVPLFKVRSSIREFLAARLVQAADDKFQTTLDGLVQIE